MDLGLKGKSALVLGASRGIGAGIANALATEGANVMIASRSADKLQANAAAMAADHGVRALSHPCDVSDLASVTELADAALQAFDGRVDILVNNTGGPPPGPIAEVPAELWLAQFQAMFLSLMTVTTRLLPAMQANKWGRVITVTSSGVRQPIPVLGISNTIRASIVNWSKTLSLSTAADGVTMNVMMPGRIATDRLGEIDSNVAERTGRSLDDIQAAAKAEIPAGRYGTVEEFGAVAAFLASERASYVTGSLISVDGGAMKAT